MAKKTVAIIGTGSIAKAHMKAWATIADRYEIIACCDLDGDKARRFAETYNIPSVYTDVAEMMEKEKPYCVSNCTWNSAHAETTIAALRGGAHVLCEKPMAISTAEAEEMAKAAKENNRLLQIGFIRRFGQDAETVKRLADAGILGDIYYGKTHFLRRDNGPGGWFNDKAYSGGGSMMDIGVHMIDLCRYLAGNPKPVSVYAAVFDHLKDMKVIGAKKDWEIEGAEKAYKNDVEDLAIATIRFDNGFVLHVEVSSALHTCAPGRCIELFGTKGGIRIDSDVEYCTSQAGMHVVSKPTAPSSFRHEEACAAEVRNFVEAIEGAPCRATAQDGIELMKIIDAIYESARTGSQVTIA